MNRLVHSSKCMYICLPYTKGLRTTTPASPYTAVIHSASYVHCYKYKQQTNSEFILLVSVVCVSKAWYSLLYVHFLFRRGVKSNVRSFWRLQFVLLFNSSALTEECFCHVAWAHWSFLSCKYLRLKNDQIICLVCLIWIPLSSFRSCMKIPLLFKIVYMWKHKVVLKH